MKGASDFNTQELVRQRPQPAGARYAGRAAFVSLNR